MIVATFTTRAKAHEYLRGHWTDAATVQILVFLCEILLILFAFVLPGNTVVNTVCVLTVDLLMVSPLKAGRALFFETLVADGDAAQISLIWRYYRHGYERTIGWRILVWGYRLMGNAVCSVPAFVLFALSGVLVNNAPTYTDRIFSMTLFGFGLLLSVCAVVITEILLMRLLFVPYLFAHTGTLREAVALSRILARNRMNTIVSLYLDHTVWVFTFPLVAPWFFTSAVFQTARAATVRRFLRENPVKNPACDLQRRKKYGRIGR